MERTESRRRRGRDEGPRPARASGTTRATAVARCAADGKTLCEKDVRDYVGCVYNPEPAWRAGACDVRAQIYANGFLAAVHAPTSAWELEADSGYSYAGVWAGDWPKAADGSCAATVGCETSGDDSCLCDVDPVARPVFSAEPSRLEVLEKCRHAAAIKPGDDAAFSLVQTNASDVVAYEYQHGGLDEFAVFVVADEVGTTIFLRNVEHVATIGAYEFRTPVQFMKLAEVTARAAAHETEALIDHLFTHQNAAPFFAHRLIQRLTSSNPSPRYVEAVVAAFRQGAYDGATYSGAYGDVGAAVAACVLHPEATSSTLDADGTSGGLREPLIKLVHFMRAMEFAPRGARQLEMNDLAAKIGEEPHASPTVFNFYQPEHQPAGAVRAASLVSPEAEYRRPAREPNVARGVKRGHRGMSTSRPPRPSSK